MIKLKPITTTDAHYQFMEKLLVDSFPPEEYRQLDELRTYTDHKKIFHNNVILNDEETVGLITYWEFKHFYYIEHFAIDPTLRNGGYGKQTLEFLCQHFSRPIVLEVEHPTEELAKRRIGFYRRHGFTLWEKAYQQPPYKPGDGYLPMYLMVYGDLNPDKDYESIRKEIHTEVYGVRDDNRTNL